MVAQIYAELGTKPPAPTLDTYNTKGQSMTAVELKAQLKEKVAARKAEIAETVECIKLENEIKYVESDLFQTRKLTEADNNVLDAYIEHIVDQYAQSKRKVSQTFGYGVIPNKVLTICKAVMYSKAEEKIELLAMTGLSETQVEEITEAFGMTAYFSPASLEIVKSVPMAKNIVEVLKQASSDMGLVSNISYGKFNAENVEYQYNRAKQRAEEALENTIKYADENLDEVAFTEQVYPALILFTKDY